MTVTDTHPALRLDRRGQRAATCRGWRCLVILRRVLRERLCGARARADALWTCDAGHAGATPLCLACADLAETGQVRPCPVPGCGKPLLISVIGRP